MQGFIDFFYLTHETPSFIEPSQKLQEEYMLSKRTKKLLDITQRETLIEIAQELTNAEEYLR